MVMSCYIKSNKIINILNEYIKFLDKLYKITQVEELNKSIKLINKLQIILNISQSDYVMFFKYDYSKTFIMFYTLLLLENGGKVINNNIIKKLPVTSNKIVLDILNTNNEELHQNNILDLNFMLKHNINKSFYRNIFSYDDNHPEGFIVLLYENEKSTISIYKQLEINRIIDNIKYLM